MQFRRTYFFTNVLPNYKIMYIHVYMRIYLEIGIIFTYAKREPQRSTIRVVILVLVQARSPYP